MYMLTIISVDFYCNDVLREGEIHPWHILQVIPQVVLPASTVRVVVSLSCFFCRVISVENIP